MNQEIANELFKYKDGKLFWKKQVRPFQNISKAAGSLNADGYRRITYKGVEYPEHRVIYTWHYGQIGEGLVIDHLNNIRDDNRIENLREATKSQNELNKHSTKGYFKCKKTNKFKAYIQRKHLGYFGTESAARLAYLMEKLQWTLKPTH